MVITINIHFAVKTTRMRTTSATFVAIEIVAVATTVNMETRVYGGNASVHSVWPARHNGR